MSSFFFYNIKLWSSSFYIIIFSGRYFIYLINICTCSYLVTVSSWTLWTFGNPWFIESHNVGTIKKGMVQYDGQVYSFTGLNGELPTCCCVGNKGLKIQYLISDTSNFRFEKYRFIETSITMRERGFQNR
jgi:hypothetical protein